MINLLNLVYYMATLEEIKNILEKEVHILHNKRNVSLQTVNGIPDPIDLQIQKGLSIVDALTDNSNDLVKVKTNYTENNRSVVEFNTDIVILDGQDYRELLRLLENGNT